MMRKTKFVIVERNYKKNDTKTNNVVKNIIKKLNWAHFAYLVTSLFRTGYSSGKKDDNRAALVARLS